MAGSAALSATSPPQPLRVCGRRGEPQFATLVQIGCPPVGACGALVIGSRASALLYVAPCFLPPILSVLSATPPDSERVPEALPTERRARRTASLCPSTLAGRRSRLSPGRRNMLGVGRVARRARPDTKPFFRALPRLTLKAGHTAGLPTNPIPLAARHAPAFAPSPAYMKCICILSIIKLGIVT